MLLFSPTQQSGLTHGLEHFFSHFDLLESFLVSVYLFIFNFNVFILPSY